VIYHYVPMKLRNERQTFIFVVVRLLTVGDIMCQDWDKGTHTTMRYVTYKS